MIGSGYLCCLCWLYRGVGGGVEGVVVSISSHLGHVSSLGWHKYQPSGVRTQDKGRIEVNFRNVKGQEMGLNKKSTGTYRHLKLLPVH